VRARELGIRLAGRPGPLNAITDVPGVAVGTVTRVEDGPTPGSAVRTGVTAVLPLGRAGLSRTVPAGLFSMNGNGELTGSHWIAETGSLGGPIMITNTHAVGTVHRGVVDWFVEHEPARAAQWLLPVVAETWDGYLNSINLASITGADAAAAIDGATTGPVAEGSHGGGTGMNCYGFKGGNGTASRLVDLGGVTYTVAAFLQANFGDRSELTVAGVPMGDLEVPCPIGEPDWFARDLAVPGGAVPGGAAPGGAGSCIAIVATDLPLTPHQCTALARRVPLGLARTGTTGSHFSGDVFLALSTANAGVLDSGFPLEPAEAVTLRTMQLLPWGWMDAVYAATVQAVEESVLNCLVNNADLTGRDGHVSYALPHDQVRERLGRT